jgi:S-formylglutathione hydrolase FrmB
MPVCPRAGPAAGRVVKKRTDKAIAITSTAAVAVIPTVLLVALKTGNGGALGLPESAGQGSSQTPAAQSSPAHKKKPKTKKTTAQPTNLYNPTTTNNNTTTTTTKKPAKPKKAGKYFLADDGAKVTAVTKITAHEFDVTVKSPALGSTQKMRILVPKSWTAGAKKTWPVVYALHGGRDTYLSWTRGTDIEETAAAWNTLVVMPEGGSGGYTDWFNHGQGGSPKWETWHIDEVQQLVERNFHAGTSRAVMGMSSGGQGAITYAARHPGMFKWASSFSGALDMLAPGVPALMIYTAAGSTSDPYRVWGDPVTNRANWKAHDPTTLIKNLRGTKIYISCGDGNGGPLDGGAQDIRYLSEQLINYDDHYFTDKAAALGIPMTVNYYSPGTHSWPYWRIQMHNTWPSMMATIGATKVS